jgi:hypothetical protein
LSLWQDEVGEEEEAKVSVEGEPVAGLGMFGRHVRAFLRRHRSLVRVEPARGNGAHHDRINQDHDSAREKQESTTQYISHGVS